MTKALLQSLIIAAGSVAISILVVRLARSGRLAFRYTIGWLGLLSIGIVFSLASGIVEPVGSLLGVTPGVVVSGTAIVVLVLICIQLSVSISGLQERVRVLSEEAALQKFRLSGKSDGGE